jgi:hypothetical protein
MRRVLGDFHSCLCFVCWGLIFVQLDTDSVLTCALNVREYHTHGTSVKHPLNETIAALMRDSDEWSNACEMADIAEIACLSKRQPGMFEIDKERVETGMSSRLNDLRTCR